MCKLKSYEVTARVLESLEEEGIPERVLEQLGEMSNTKYSSRHSFVLALKEILSEQDLKKHSEEIIKMATRLWFRRNFLIFASFLIFLLIFIYGAVEISISVMDDRIDLTNFGILGDSFGVVTALFTALAFVGLIGTLWLQSRELVLQRRELRLSRNELTKQREQLRSQGETLQRRNFEATLFQMLTFHNVKADSIRTMTPGGRTIVGRDAFREMYNKLRARYENQLASSPNCSLNEAIDKSYASFLSEYEIYIGPYFRNLYYILKQIDEVAFNDPKDKVMYSNLVRAQLADYELLLLFYAGLSQFGRGKFKPLLEKYSFLANVPLCQLIEERHRGLYGELAFGTKNV